MAYIDSSTLKPNPLRAAAEDLPLEHEVSDIGDDQEEDEEGYDGLREAKPRKGSLLEALVDQIDDVNLARYLSEEVLREIGMAVCDEFEIDDQSRKGWEEDAEKAMKFALQKADPKQFPWPNCANTIFPMMLQATVDFASRTYMALIQGPKVVKGQVWGSDRGTPVMENGQPKMGPPPPGSPPGTPPQPIWLIAPGEKRARAERVGTYMSWQLLKQMPEWEPQTDQLLHQIPIVGGAARKTFRDVAEERNASLFVSLMNLVWNYDAPSFESAPRHTEKLLYYPHEIADFERVDADENGEGMFLPLHYGAGDALGSGGTTFGFRRDQESGGDNADPDAPHLFLEQHRRWDLDGDGYAEPYVVTVHQRSNKVVRIVARYDKDGIKASKSGDEIQKITPVDHYTLIPFLPSLDGGSYPTGWGHLLRGLNEQINTTVNQMLDAGTLQNAGGGFIGDGLNMPSGQTLFQVGKYVRVNTKGASLREQVLPIPFPGPSNVLFQLLGTLVEAAKGIASLQNVLGGDAAIANAPPTTVLALIEQGLTLYTAIHKRIYRAFGSEFDKLARLNKLHLKEKETYQFGDDEHEIDPQDFALGGAVAPIADPKMITDMQKLTRAQILLGFKDDPLINQKEIRLRLFEAANFERIDDLFSQPPQPSPQQLAMAQLEMDLKQAELGRLRAAEQKDQTQAFLNLALARAKATGPEEAFIEAQLDFLRLHIEALNTQVKAATVDHKFHATHLQDVQEHARILASQQPDTEDAGDATPTPGPRGPFPVAPGPAPQPVGAGLGAVAPSSDHSGLPPLPGGSIPGVAGTGGGLGGTGSA